jgi:hypothetical protein
MSRKLIAIHNYINFGHWRFLYIGMNLFFSTIIYTNASCLGHHDEAVPTPVFYAES